MAYHGAISVQFALTVHATMTVTMETALKCLNVIHEYLCIYIGYSCVYATCVRVLVWCIMHCCTCVWKKHHEGVCQKANTAQGEA